MIVKIFKSGGVGKNKSAKSVSDYLLNVERVENGTAKIVRGDKHLTDLAINACTTFNSTYTSGCLSFSKDERQLTEQEKQNLMADFEQALLPSFDKQRYACYWVEHTDKERLELNFVFAKIDLDTYKNLSVYQHSRDLKRLNCWKEIKIQELGLIDPNDPKHEREQPFFIRDGNKKLIDFDPKNVIENNKKQLGDYLKMQVENGIINNRQDVINEIEALEIDNLKLFEVVKQTKSSLTIKDLTSTNPNTNTFRLKGGIYARDFAIEPSDRTKEQSDARENDSVISQRQLRRHQEYIANASERLEHAKREYKKLEQWRADDIIKRHPIITSSFDKNNRPSRAFGRKYDSSNATNTEAKRELTDSSRKANPANRENGTSLDSWATANGRADTTEFEQSIKRTSRHDKSINTELRPSRVVSRQTSWQSDRLSRSTPSSRKYQSESNFLDSSFIDNARRGGVHSILRKTKQYFPLVSYGSRTFYYANANNHGASNHSNFLPNIPREPAEAERAIGVNHADSTTAPREQKRATRGGIRLFERCRSLIKQISSKFADRQRVNTAIADREPAITRANSISECTVATSKRVSEQLSYIEAERARELGAEQELIFFTKESDKRLQFIDKTNENSERALQHSDSTNRQFERTIDASNRELQHSDSELQASRERADSIDDILQASNRELQTIKQAIQRFDAQNARLRERTQESNRQLQPPSDNLPTGYSELQASDRQLQQCREFVEWREQERLECERQAQAQRPKFSP